MALIDVSNLAHDADFRERIAAAVAGQEDQPTAWADAHQWRIAASPGFGDAYASALVNGIERPGLDPAVITDGMILAAVAAVMG
jgi:hypothetical protein